MTEEKREWEFDEAVQKALYRRICRRRWIIFGIIASPFVLLLLLILGVRAYLWTTGTRVFNIPTPAMENTLSVGARVFVNKPPLYQPLIGDIIVFRVPEIVPQYDPKKAIYIKRVVALGGDEIEIMEDGSIQVNGKELVDPPFFRVNRYHKTIPGAQAPFTKGRVPEGEVFVIGDNSGNSYDSRFWGRSDLGKPVVGVPVENIIGKAFYVISQSGDFGEIVDRPKEIRDATESQP